MTAGYGISHAEESPNDRAGRNQLVQLWIALPDAERERAPMFQHCPELPRIHRDGFGIACGRPYEVLHAFFEAFVRMVYQNIRGSDCGEDIVTIFDGGRRQRVPGGVPQ